ncbi:MAG: MOSC N-terminal beta barrel domain-containing protein [Pseudomonadota bacterium]
MRRVTDILRHPLKSHGREALETVTLTAGQSMPYDRTWAVAHDASKADGSEWASCANFSRVSKAPALMAISSEFDEASGQLTLSHPDLTDLTFNPDTDGNTFLRWVKPLVPANRAQPDRIIRLDGRGFTDSHFASVTLCNHASHRAVEDRVGHPLSIHRWRGNIWFDGEDPWTEFDWMGKKVRIGDCVLSVRERTDRCMATTSNPDTGLRDVDILQALDSWGHQDFSMRAEVVEGGIIRRGDLLEVL